MSKLILPDDNVYEVNKRLARRCSSWPWRGPKGIPARARVGGAAYFAPGWLCEHAVAEVWDEAEGRWRLVDPQMDTARTAEVNGVPVDWLDLTPGQFVTGPRGWQAARDGTCDPERHVVSPARRTPADTPPPHGS